jgi:HD-GYP domain-containing protein (c-di-GMP phosphodiesterase class II)
MTAEISRKNDGRLYSSTIINTFIKLLKKNYTYVDIGRLLEDSGMELYQIEDEGHWFTQNEVDRFYATLVKATGNNNIAREAGRYSASPEAIGTMTKYLIGLIGPAKVFETIERVAGGYTKSCSYSSRKIRKNEIEITVTPLPGVEEKPYQCENRIGYFEAAVRLFNERLPKIEHPECVFAGGACCRYRISWQDPPTSALKRIRNYTAVAGLGFLAHAYFLLPGFPFEPVALGFLLLLMLFTFFTEGRERKKLIKAIDNLRSSTDRLLDNLNVNYNHALMIDEIGQTISKQIQVDEILSGVIGILRKRLDYDRGLILMPDREGRYLVYKTGYGYSREQEDVLAGTSFHLNKPDSRGVLVMCYHQKKPFLVNDIEEIKDDLSLRSLDFAIRMGSKSFICCPIVYENACLGVLAVDNKISKRPLFQSDINLLMGITPEIGISIRNALLIQGQEEQFLSILQTLAASIDARDFLTAGHSTKVTEYALGICRELRLSREYTEMIRVSAQLHDYGKIGIKDSILKKAGPLDPSEREEIKTHAEKTEAILKRINFKGIYREVPVIAGSHHEKLDGTGYPRGLSGAEIPLGARIIAVADFFEAITAKRHYRDPMPEEEAIDTLKQQEGRHLDGAVIQAFLNYYRRGKGRSSRIPQQLMAGV